MFTRFVALTLGVLIANPDSHAAEPPGQPARPLYIVFDGSNSMWGELPDGSRKIETARAVFEQLDDALFEGREIALRLYGHRRAKDCSDTELAVPFTSSSKGRAELAEAIGSVSPRGKTPITRSLTAARRDFHGRAGDILLISDGIETCDADPCELVDSWSAQNVDIRVHVVGLGLTDIAREAMQCIAQSSGTEYMDAEDAGQLSRAIEASTNARPPEAGSAQPRPQHPTNEVRIVGVDAKGRFLPVTGTISKPDMPAVEIRSNSRYVFEGGKYAIRAGVPTASGEIYRPTAHDVEIGDTGTTTIELVLPRPPMLTTRFMENGEEVRGTTAYAFSDDKEVFALRAGEESFVMPGTYEFRASLRTDNRDLSVTETVVEDEDRDIVFTLIETVHTYFHVTNRESGERLRQHQELWQGGQLKYRVHYANGAHVQPGVYTLKSESVHTPYQIDDVVVPPGSGQTLAFDILLGKARVYYRVPESAHIDENTGQPSAKKDWRCWFYRMNGDRKSARRGPMQQCDGTEIYFSEGRYLVRTTKHLGSFRDTYFDVKAGETTEVDVRLQDAD